MSVERKIKKKSPSPTENARICFSCIAFWSITLTVSVKVGASAFAMMDRSECDCWMSMRVEKKLVAM